MKMIMGRPIMLAVVLTGLLALRSIAELFVLGPDWAAFAPASCTATGCFCELPRTGTLLLQPANTWSSYVPANRAAGLGPRPRGGDLQELAGLHPG
jgi:hypothetical protein